MDIKDIRNIKENDKVLINSIEHVCTMSSGYASFPNKTFRFTNFSLPKRVRHSVYNEYYYPCLDLLKDINKNKICFSFFGKHKDNLQLSFF